MIKTSLYPQGTRVTIRRGRMPMDPSLVDRTGTVVRTYANKPEKYGVVLDGEEQIRAFREDELAVVQPALSLDEAGSSGPGIGPGTGRV